MSRGLSSQQQNPRDYGATSSSANAITSALEVNFSGFSPTEFMSLSEAIAKNITNIKSSCTQLERVNRLMDSGRDKPETHERTQKLEIETNLQVEQAKNDLSRLTNVVRRGDKPHKLQLSRLTTDLTTFVQKYSKIQQIIATKKKQRLAKQLVAQQQDEENSDVINMSESDREQLIQRQLERARNLEFDQELLIDRENRFKAIEVNLLDINKTMKDLTVIVNRQGEQINTIEVEIEQTAANVEDGEAELRKAATYRQSYRRKILILLIIAVIISLIVTSIIVSKLKS